MGKLSSKGSGAATGRAVMKWQLGPKIDKYLYVNIEKIAFEHALLVTYVPFLL